MATTRSLEANLSAVDNISDALSNISESATEAAGGMSIFGESSEEAGDEVEDTEDEVDELSDTFSGLIDNVLSATESLDLAQEKIESVGDESTQTTAKVSALASSLKALDSIDDIDIDINQRLRGSDVGDGSRKRVVMGEGVDKVEVEDFLSEIGVENIPDEIDVEDPPDEIDVEDFPSHIDVDDVPRKIRVEDVDRSLSSRIPDFDGFSPADPEGSILPGGRQSFGSRDVDLDIDWPSDSFEVDAGGGGSSIARMMGDGGGFNFGGLLGETVDETGDLAENLFDVDNAGNAAKETLSEIGDASVNLGPLNTSLKTTLTILPGVIAMMSSLAAVTGGFAIGGLGALGGLGAMLGGGLWMAGQQRAQSMPMQEGEDGGFRQATAMEGLQSLLSDYGSQAKEALRPLQNQEFADLSLDFLQGGITLLGDFATSIRRLSPYLMAFADVLGQSFWQNEPAFIAEMEKLIVAMLPYVSDFITYFIREIPDALAFMRKEGVQLLPILGNFLTAFIDLLAPMTEIGTAIWSVLLPALTVLMDVFTGILSPIATFVVPVFETLGTVLNWISEEFSGAIQFVSTFLGTLLALAAVPTILSAVSAAVSVLSGALTLLTISNPFGWIAIGIALAVALLSHFDLVDDVVGGLIDLFDGLYNLVDDTTGALADIVGEWVIDVLVNLLGEENVQEAQDTADDIRPNLSEEDRQGLFSRSWKSDSSYGVVGRDAVKGNGLLGGWLGGNNSGSGGSGGSGNDLGDLPTAEEELSDSNATQIGSMDNYGQGGDTYNVNVDARGSSESAGRIQRFVNQGVEEAKTDSRQRTSGGN